MKSKAVVEGGSYGLSQSNPPKLTSSDAPKLNSGDEEKINSILKNGIDGWGFAQKVVFKHNDDVLLLLNPKDKNSFREITYISYYQYNKNHIKMMGDKIIPMAEAFKYIAIDEEAYPKSKKTLHNDEKILLKKQGWNFIRSYYENANRCSSNAYVLDYYSVSLNKIKKNTYCNGVKTEQILEPYIAEQIYVKSGMRNVD
jgi:hypothetical protein